MFLETQSQFKTTYGESSITRTHVWMHISTPMNRNEEIQNVKDFECFNNILTCGLDNYHSIKEWAHGLNLICPTIHALGLTWGTVTQQKKASGNILGSCVVLRPWWKELYYIALVQYCCHAGLFCLTSKSLEGAPWSARWLLEGSQHSIEAVISALSGFQHSFPAKMLCNLLMPSNQKLSLPPWQWMFWVDSVQYSPISTKLRTCLLPDPPSSICFFKITLTASAASLSGPSALTLLWII